MWILHRAARVLGAACLVLTVYLCFAFYNFENDVELLRARHMAPTGRPDRKQAPKFNNTRMQPSNRAKRNPANEGRRAQVTARRAVPVVPGHLLAPHLLHLRVEHTVKSSLLPSIIFDNLHDPLEVENIIRDYEQQLKWSALPHDEVTNVTDKCWKLAASWVRPKFGLRSASTREKSPSSRLGQLLHAMSDAPILKADVAKKGTQLKLLLTLDGGQQALFKPMFYSRGHVIREGPFAGADRHNGEIAAFHLAALLGMDRTPFVAGRRVNLSEIYQKSTPELKATFYQNDGGQTCFYGKCYYCKRANGVCADAFGQLEGAVILMLPSSYRLQSHRSPWQRTYREGVYARWETDMSYCKKVRFVPEFSGRRIHDLMDNAIIDFLIGNADRHHVETFQAVPDSLVLLIDNGKSFGNPEEDEFSILAPLYQCCLLRNQTYHRLAMFVGKLGPALERVTRNDPLHPLLSTAHLEAIDRRLKLVLATLLYCKKHSTLEIVP